MTSARAGATAKEPGTAVPSHVMEVEPECFEFLKAAYRLAHVAKDECISKVGELGTNFMIVNSGLLVVETSYPDDRFIPTQFVPPGRGFAPSHTPYAPTVFQMRAIVPSVVTLLPASVVYYACKLFPLFAQGFLASVLQRTNDGYLSHARTNHMPLEGQIAFFFWWLSMGEPLSSAKTKALPWKLPQQLLADFFGVSREEVSRKVTLLERQGHLEKLNDGYILHESITSTFKAYGEPSEPVSFIASGLLLREP